MTSLNKGQSLGGYNASFSGKTNNSSATEVALKSGLKSAFGTVLNAGMNTVGLKGGDNLSGDIEDQRELQRFTMVTNLAKTQHDSRMAAVRNMRP